jgi:glycosyltransferase involved in cell wall biosynthesis
LNKPAVWKEPDGSSTSLKANGEPARWPRITVVTAVYNGEAYLEDTIRSLIYQGYPNLEYIIVNDGSTDRTAEIVRDYERYLTASINQTNQGLYAALNTGFAQSTGDVMGWLNCSDKLHTGGLSVVGSVFANFPEIEWITGRPTGFNTLGMTTHIDKLKRWSRYRFLAGANQYIQQESTFWRKSLWERAGGRVDSSYRDVGDFELWVRFFRHARLYSIDCLIAGYRFHPDAISIAGREAYDRRCNEIIERELHSTPRGAAVRFFRLVSQGVIRIPKVRGIWNRTLIRALYELPGPDWAPLIQSGSEGWVMRR